MLTTPPHTHNLGGKGGASYSPNVAYLASQERGDQGDAYGEPFQAWEMWPSPHSERPVGSEVGTQDPCPRIGSPMGNQALIVPRPL